MKQDNDSIHGSNENVEKEPIAPDGGYSWVVLIASFLASVIVDGVCFATGVYFIEFVDYFREDKAKTAWVGSVLNGMYMIMGPIAGALTERFGCRPVAITGAIWSSAAFLLSTFSTNVNTMILTFGVLGGAGFGLMYLPAVLIVGLYFDKKRAFATGIALCGSGIGTFIIAPLCTAMIAFYAWRGSVTVLAGIVLNGAVLGALYRPLTEKEMDRHRKQWRIAQVARENRKHCCITTDDVIDIVEVNEEPLSNNIDVKTAEDSNKTLLNTREVILHRTNLTTTLSSSVHSIASLSNQYKLSKTAQNTNQCTRENTTNKCGIYETLKEIAKATASSLDLRMLTNPVFMLYCLSCLLCMAGFFTPFVFLPTHAIGMGSDMSKAVFLLSILGIANTVGRVMTGWVSDRPWSDCLVINNLALIVGGLATCAVPWLTNYVLLAIYACIFGLCIAAFVTLRPIVLIDLIGLDNLANTLGIVVLCQGITTFIGAPIAGWLYDVTGSYNAAFYVAGILISLAGIVGMPLRRLAHYLHEKEMNKQNINKL